MSRLYERAEDFVPNPNQSHEQALRFQHKDLCTLDDRELRREQRRAAIYGVLLAEDHEVVWCEEREQRVMAERARRGKHGKR